MALENIRQRLALIYDLEAQLHYGVAESGVKSEVKSYSDVEAKSESVSEAVKVQNFVVKMHFPVKNEFPQYFNRR